ncbi:hypothetical protein NX059_002072 [Plenodomus lindquistii]|nr:hypothetical protein NX059_002072 [Plenodomus lindquistii]
MRFSLLLSSYLLFLAPSVASLQASKCNGRCGKALPEDIHPGKSVNLTIPSKSGIDTRKYRLHLPKSYDINTDVPLIVSFHNRGQNAKYQEALSQFSNASYGFEGIAVYPEGVPNSKGTQQFQGDPDSPSSINDIKFTLELLSHLQSTFCIDPSRIYANGKSNGGGFTGLLACDPEVTKYIAAFAPVSGASYLDSSTSQLPACSPSRSPIPILELHGWVDKTIPYLSGINTRGNANSTNIPK